MNIQYNNTGMHFDFSNCIITHSEAIDRIFQTIAALLKERSA